MKKHLQGQEDAVMERMTGCRMLEDEISFLLKLFSCFFVKELTLASFFCLSIMAADPNRQKGTFRGCFVWLNVFRQKFA